MGRSAELRGQSRVPPPPARITTYIDRILGHAGGAPWAAGGGGLGGGEGGASSKRGVVRRHSETRSPAARDQVRNSERALTGRPGGASRRRSSAAPKSGVEVCASACGRRDGRGGATDFRSRRAHRAVRGAPGRHADASAAPRAALARPRGRACCGVTKRFGGFTSPSTGGPRDRRRRVLSPAGAIRVRQDHDAPDDRRLRAADRGTSSSRAGPCRASHPTGAT